jgi:hypothetical protein
MQSLHDIFRCMSKNDNVTLSTLKAGRHHFISVCWHHRLFLAFSFLARTFSVLSSHPSAPISTPPSTHPSENFWHTAHCAPPTARH